jgi:hypothetical protein
VFNDVETPGSYVSDTDRRVGLEGSAPRVLPRISDPDEFVFRRGRRMVLYHLF